MLKSMWLTYLHANFIQIMFWEMEGAKPFLEARSNQGRGLLIFGDLHYKSFISTPSSIWPN